MSTAREEILGRVRAAIAPATATANPATEATPAPAPVTTPRSYRHTDRRPRHELAALFCARVADYRAEVQRIRAEQLRDAIAGAAARHGAHRLAIPPGLPKHWRPAQIELISDDHLTPHALDALDGVITGCTLAIAETGTIALSAAPPEGRRLLSLVPDLHICVVAADQIVGSVPEAIAQLAEITHRDRRPVTLISGPSATSDIELQRVEGVHGPRRLVVLLIEELS